MTPNGWKSRRYPGPRVRGAAPEGFRTGRGQKPYRCRMGTGTSRGPVTGGATREPPVTIGPLGEPMAECGPRPEPRRRCHGGTADRRPPVPFAPIGASTAWRLRTASTVQTWTLALPRHPRQTVSAPSAPIIPSVRIRPPRETKVSKRAIESSENGSMVARPSRRRENPSSSRTATVRD